MLRRRSVLLLCCLSLALILLVGQAAPAAAGGGPANGPPPAPTRLVIPKIKLDAAIEPVGLKSTRRGYEWDMVPNAAGWHDLSATPGHPGNTVLSGHNGSRAGRVFRNLWRLKVGDRITVFVGEQPFEYEVKERAIFRELFASKAQRTANAKWIGQFPDERLTLVTCHPTWTNTHRLVIVAVPVPPPSRDPLWGRPSFLPQPWSS